MFKYSNILVTTVASGIALRSEIKGKQLAANNQNNQPKDAKMLIEQKKSLTDPICFTHDHFIHGSYKIKIRVALKVHCAKQNMLTS